MANTLDQLKEMSNEQLDEIVGRLQWTTIGGDELGCGARTAIYYKPEHGDLIRHYEYHPSTNKEQAWDLMVNLLKVGFLVEYDDGTFGVKKYDYSFLGSTDNKDPLIAVVIASILHLQEIE